MKLWRLSKPEHVALTGEGAEKLGGRYSSPGNPLVSFATEAGLAVLIGLRYLPAGREEFEAQMSLGWTNVDHEPERVPDHLSDSEKITYVDDWCASARSLLAAVKSAVLPEADVILFNPRHPHARDVRPLVCRKFTFAECLHRPPMLDHFRNM